MSQTCAGRFEKKKNGKVRKRLTYSIPVYDDLRSMYLPNKFYSTHNLHKFNLLMCSHSSNIIQLLAMFLFCSFKERSELLNQDS